MTTVNLLPSDVLERGRVRRVTIAVGAGAAILVVFLGFVFLLQLSRLSHENRRLAMQQEVNRGLQARIAGVAQFAHLKQQVADAQNQRAALLAGQVLWSGALESVSQTIPGDIFLTSMNDTANVSATGQAATSNGLIGAIQFSGVAQNQPAIAEWLTRLEQVTGWVNPWVSTIAQSMDSSGNVVFQFTVTVDLSQAATTPVKPL